MLSASMGIGNGKETRSMRIAYVSTRDPRTLMLYRDLAESMDRVGTLEEENEALVRALRYVANSEDFDADTHGEVTQILLKVALACFYSFISWGILTLLLLVLG